jgi:malate/lactate dehydrogenase
LPSIVGRDGVAEVLTPQLSDEEAKALDQSAESIAKALERVQ